MPAGIYQLHWYPQLVQGGWFGFGVRGSAWVWDWGLNRKQSTCLVSIAHSNVCICMWLPVCSRSLSLLYVPL